jgi:hypothetical protein
MSENRPRTRNTAAAKAGADTRYLQRRHLMWHLVVPVPKPLWGAMGKRRLEKTLKTRDLREAQRLRRLHLADLQRVIDDAQRAANAAPGDLHSEAMELRRWAIRKRHTRSLLVICQHQTSAELSCLCVLLLLWM